MKKSLIALALVCVMVFAFAATAMADHSPQFYFNDFSGNAALQGAPFQAVFPTGTIIIDPAIINNGQFGGDLNNMHGNYSQTTAKCGACHAVHRAPGALTSSYSTPDSKKKFGLSGSVSAAVTGTAVTSSRYAEDAWTAEAETQLLLKTTAARACLYCHVADSAYQPMYGGDMAMNWINGPAGYNWNDFYGHTTGCTSCHAVHGAGVFTAYSAADVAAGGQPAVVSNAPDNTSRFILKYAGVKAVKTDWASNPAAWNTAYPSGYTAAQASGDGLVTVIQKEVYTAPSVESGYATGSPLYNSLSDAKTGILAAAPLADSVTAKSAAITAQCTMCHANYASSDATVNAGLDNLMVWQPGSWASSNGSRAHTTTWGQAGVVYNAGAPAVMMMAYKNHPMGTYNKNFIGKGASAGVFDRIQVATASSWTCQSCHNAPEGGDAGTVVSGVIGKTPFGARQIAPGFAGYLIQVFPHYNPGYYKFMAAANQGALDTPTSYAGVDAGKTVFYNTIQGADGNIRPGRPAIMNDGYCTKCHPKVGANDGTGF